MPKIKTHTGAKKRFGLTKNGKVKRATANRRHILTSQEEHKAQERPPQGGLRRRDQRRSGQAPDPLRVNPKPKKNRRLIKLWQE